MHAGYSHDITGLLNFPLTEHLKTIFSPGGSLDELGSLLREQACISTPISRQFQHHFNANFNAISTSIPTPI